MSSSSSHTASITVYTTSWCAFCHTEMQWLDKLGFTYISKDVEADKDAYAELTAKNGGAYQGVPVTDIGGELVLGFDRPKIQDAIARHGIKPKTA